MTISVVDINRLSWIFQERQRVPFRSKLEVCWHIFNIQMSALTIYNLLDPDSSKEKNKKKTPDGIEDELTADLPSALSYTSLKVVADRIDPSYFPVAPR